MRAQQNNNTGQSLNQTFLPKDLFKKTSSKNVNTLINKNTFEKTSGNIYIEIEPHQIKFNGYELDKVYTANIKIINKAPIPQRVHILPPDLTNNFSIKVNKKGAIPSGMNEIIQVSFKASQHKYEYDVIKINTETQNFIVPVYAYPSIPNLRDIFPKIIDFGCIQLKQSSSNYYPIVNSIPISFQYQFLYKKQCNEIIISPLEGVITANSTHNIEIVFIPTAKCTYIAEVSLLIKQFDFQPINIRIIGNGKDTKVVKRIKSSKLTPINTKPESINKHKEEEEAGQKNKTMKNFSTSKKQLINSNLNHKEQHSGVILKKASFVRSNYPKLLSNTKKSSVIPVNEEANSTLIKSTSQNNNLSERQYLNRFSKQQELDKLKDIRFEQFLGDEAMNAEEWQFQNQVKDEVKLAQMKALESACLTRYNPELYADVPVEFAIVPKQTLTWDDKKNDELANRKVALQRFMKAGSQIIVRYRLAKRLAKIKYFLSDCKNKIEVKKKVQENYTKALDAKQGNQITVDLSQLSFDIDNNFKPSYFQLQHTENATTEQLKAFKPEGKPQFDDLKQVKQIQPHKIQMLRFADIPFPADYINLSKNIPATRASGQQQYSIKTSSLPNYQLFQPTTCYTLPLKVPAHHFIYNDSKVRRYKNYNEVDEKDIEYLFSANQQVIEDQFQGWTKGDPQMLKAKFMRNTGCQYTTFNGFNGSTYKNDIGFLGRIGEALPNTITDRIKEDQIEAGDSDQENIINKEPENVIKLLEKIEASNPSLKERREKKEIKNPEKDLKRNIQENLLKHKKKATSEHITKIREFNKFVEKTENRILF